MFVAQSVSLLKATWEHVNFMINCTFYTCTYVAIYTVPYYNSYTFLYRLNVLCLNIYIQIHIQVVQWK